MTEIDTELRANLGLMNNMFNDILNKAQIPIDNIQDADVTTSDDFSLIGEMLLGKLSLIEKCCDTAAASTQKKFDARTIKDKISMKKRQLTELEAENAALVETTKRQEKALKQMNQTDDETVEAQQNILKLKNQLQAAQREIKILEEKRHGLMSDNRRLKGQLQNTQRSVGKEDTLEGTNEEKIKETIQTLEEKQKQLEIRKQREQAAYQKKMKSLKDQKDQLAQKKTDLEMKVKEKQKELELIHEKAGKRYPQPMSTHK